MKKTITITDPIGIHARPASNIVKETMKLPNKVNLIYKGQATDAKSILGLMSLGVKTNEEVTLEVIGENEEEVLNTLIESLKVYNLI